MNKTIFKLILTIFFGMFGVHKFVEGKIKMGFIYLFTGGLFCIGWIVDILKITMELIRENSTSVTKIQPQTNIVQSSSLVSNHVNINKGTSNLRLVTLDLNNINEIKEKFIAFDIETTGLNSYSDRIVELGAVVFENGLPVDKFSSLVNPNKSISPEASRVNNITNEMLLTAPLESEVYEKFVEFIKSSLDDNICICAHNATFDIGFLSNTLNRLGYDCNISYIDTLSISRKVLNNNVINHKQETIAKYFDIENEAKHRAVTDAETCGKILVNLLPLVLVELEKEQKNIEKCIFSDKENIISSYFQSIIYKNFEDKELFGFRKNSSGYIDMCYLYNILRYKNSKNGFYIILPCSEAKKLKLKTEECSLSEGGTENIRVYFNNPKSLLPIEEYIIKEYRKALKNARSYMSNSEYCKRNAYESRKNLKQFNQEEIERYIKIIDQMDIDLEYENKEIDDYKNVEIHANHLRVPLSEIKNLNDSSKGVDEGYLYWEQGEENRKNKNYELALNLFDKSRFNGYDAPVLYESYAMLYHSLKDYHNEVEILNEGIDRLKRSGGIPSVLEARRNKALQLIIKENQDAEIKMQKVKEKELKRIQKEVEEKNKINHQKQPIEGRHIYQLDDNENIIKEFISISEATRETGINSKSIRDAANGIQKHAGGYVWKFKN